MLRGETITLRTVLLLLLLLRTVAAQGPTSVVPLGKVAFCRGDASESVGCILPPRRTYYPDPEYPKKARKAHQQGTVVLELTVGVDGLPRDVKVARSVSPELDQAAMDAVNQWKFVAAMKEGKFIALRVNVEVSFHLRQ
jgi:TonB family protein